jgi:hypothetical protein
LHTGVLIYECKLAPSLHFSVLVCASSLYIINGENITFTNFLIPLGLEANEPLKGALSIFAAVVSPRVIGRKIKILGSLGGASRKSALVIKRMSER